jgi:serine/threonine-protein kinase RsbW
VSNDFSGTEDGGVTTSDSLDFRVRTAARATAIPTLRTLVADLALRQDFDLDSVEDLRMALDEACGMLLAASSDGELECVFSASPEQISLVVSVQTLDRASFDEEGLSWQLVKALVTAVRKSVTPIGDGRRELSIELTLRSKAPSR